MTLHAERFTGRVADYVRYRTRYPEAVLDVLEARCGLRTEHTIADIGAGTGMLAELFLEHGNPVDAVEPNADMRAACEGLQSHWPRLRVHDATSEHTGLPNASIDFITAGRAFHWFEPVATVHEFRRILRPGGWVVLVSSSRLRDDNPQSIAYEAILREHGTDYEENRVRYEIDAVVEKFFHGGELFRETIPTHNQLDLPGLLGQTQSLSVTPQPGHPKFDAMQVALREHFERWANDGILDVPSVCRMVCGRF